MARREFMITIGLFLISLFFLIMLPFQVVSTPISRKSDFITITPATFPTMMAVLLVILTGYYLFSLWKRRKQIKVEENDKEEEDSTNIKTVLLAGIILFVYTALLDVLGYWMASILLCSGLSYVYKGRWYEVLIAGSILPTVFYLLFKLLYVPLPTGIWF